MMTKEDYDYYGIYAPMLEETEKNILHQITNLLNNETTGNANILTEHILSRIKHADSMQKKLERKHLPTNAASALTHSSDAIGIRLVTHFIGDVYTILQRLEDCPSFHIVKIKDYISDPKPNGYRSLHVILSVPIAETYGLPLSNIQLEVQIRTIAMDCWASLEHQMKYKKQIENADLLIMELKRCADEMASTDLSLQTIREMIQTLGGNEDEIAVR